jgi:hypothetical protein
MATGTISVGLAFTAVATMAAASALLDADADRADLELRLIELLLKDRVRVHPFEIAWHLRLGGLAATA